MRFDLLKLQEQNRELIKRNQKLSNTVDALRKERELAYERDKLKQERKGYTEFTKKIIEFSDDVHEEHEVKVLQQKLASRDKEIESLVRKFDESETGKDTRSKSSREEEEEVYPVGSVLHKSTLNKLIEEQTISSSLRSNNTELQLRVASLESEIEKLHVQNSHNLLLVEQANAAAQAATNLIATSTKPRKKSFFGIRRSGRKKSSMESSPAKTSTDIKTSLSNSQPSLDESLSEHDLSSYLTRKCEPTAIPYNPFNRTSEAQLLETSIKLALEEKSEVERQLECLRNEIHSQQNRIEELVQEDEKKERIYFDAVEEMGGIKQALQLTTRERDLLVSETEGLCFEIESLRAENNALKGKEVKAVLKEKQEMEFLRSENKALMSEIRTLIVSSDGLETSLSQLKREKVARDVRDHETKLKLKKSEKEKEKLKRELEETKQLLEKMKIKATENSVSKPPSGSPKITFSRNSESPARDKSSPTTGQQQSQTPSKKHVIGFPVYLDDKPLKNHILHERAQSEDFTSSIKSVPMHRTSSGGTKVVAMQTTLPIRETPLKVEEKSLMSTSLPVGGNLAVKLGSFQPLSPKSGVNSLVKMFETSKSKEEVGSSYSGDETTTQINKSDIDTTLPTSTQTTIPSTQQQNSCTQSKSLSSCETTPDISADKTKEKTLDKERRFSSSGKHSEKEELSDTTERKTSSTCSTITTSTPIRKTSNNTTKTTTQGSSTTKDNNQSTTTTTSKVASIDNESPANERKNSNSSIRKLSHGSSEARYSSKKEDLRPKDHRRTTSLVITKECLSNTASKKLKENSEKNEKENISTHSNAKTTSLKPANISQQVNTNNDTCKEKLNTITESATSKTNNTNNKGTKLTVSKHVSRFSVNVEDVNPPLDDSLTNTAMSSITAEKSQTWPTKTTNETKKVVPSTNTLPSSSKNGVPDKQNSTSPTQLGTSLSISKPKPPPTVNSKTPQNNAMNSPSAACSGDQTPLGIVRNLRSSWEKKAQNPSLKPITKTGSANVPLSTHDQLLSSQMPGSPNRPITKSGSGPPGVILSSPGIIKPSPPLSVNSPISPTSKFSRTFHSPLVKTGSTPLITNVPMATTSSITGNTVATTPVAQQNGVTTAGPYSKGSVSKRISSYQSSEIETETRKKPTINGVSSPKSIRRPASLYVSSSNSNDNKQLSSLISILQEKTSSSPPPPVLENKHNILPIKKLEQYVD